MASVRHNQVKTLKSNMKFIEIGHGTVPNIIFYERAREKKIFFIKITNRPSQRVVGLSVL